MNKETWTISDKIEILKGFSPIETPVFDGNEDAIGYVIWNLYNRVCDAIKSYVVLIENKQYYDAFIIAGHALETCSILSYIKDHGSDEDKRKHYNRYLAKSSVGRLIAVLEMYDNLEKELSWATYAILLKIFYPVGSSIVKNSKNVKEKHEEVIKQINSRIGSNKDKIKILKRDYEAPRINEYIEIFSNNLDNIDEELFAQYYTKYCNYKHSNMLASGALAGDVEEHEINRTLDLLLIITAYLQKSDIKQFSKEKLQKEKKSFTINDEIIHKVKLEKEAFVKRCQKIKVKLSQTLPIVSVLDSTLQGFSSSSYYDSFKAGVINWIEGVYANIYASNIRLYDKDINAIGKNLEWYNKVVKVLIENQSIFQEKIFNLKLNDKNFTAEINLIGNILNIFNEVFGQTLENKEDYEKRLANFKRLEKAYRVFIKNTQEYVEDISDKNLDHVGYLMGMAPALNDMMNIFETDIINSKPKSPKYFSQKNNDTNIAIVRAIVKMINSYIESYYTITDNKTEKTKIIIKARQKLLAVIGNKFLETLEKREDEYFTENRIKGLLKEQ